MEVKDLLFVTEENTKVEICDLTEVLWEGTVDEIDFVGSVPYGHYEISNVTIRENTLQIYI
jgi:hypothetical protein